MGKEVIELNKLISTGVEILTPCDFDSYVGKCFFEFGDDSFVVEQVCTPDLKALFGGIVRELGDFDYEEMNFHYFAKRLDNVSKMEDAEEIEAQGEMRKATAGGRLI